MIKYRITKGRNGNDSIKIESKEVSLKEMAKRISRRSGLPEADVILLIEDLKVELASSMSKGERVSLGDFGTFALAANRNKAGVQPGIRYYPGKEIVETIESANFIEIKD